MIIAGYISGFYCVVFLTLCFAVAGLILVLFCGLNPENPENQLNIPKTVDWVNIENLHYVSLSLICVF